MTPDYYFWGGVNSSPHVALTVYEFAEINDNITLAPSRWLMAVLTVECTDSLT